MLNIVIIVSPIYKQKIILQMSLCFIAKRLKPIFDASSYVTQDDQIVKNFVRIGNIWKVLLLYACDGDGLTHQNEQISIHSLPMDNGRVSRLK